MFDSLKKEVTKRREENKQVKIAIEQEQKRLKDKREHAKKNILRKKIAVIDNISTAREEKRDERILEDYKEQQHQSIMRDREERRNAMIKANSGKMIVAFLALVLVIAIASFIGNSIHNHNLTKQYDKAVNYIVEENYADAKKELKGLEINDAITLSYYVDLQLSLDKYVGEAKSLLEKMQQLSIIENPEVREQYDDAVEQLDSAKTAQTKINKINLITIKPDAKNNLEQISQMMSGLDERYGALVNTEKLDLAKQIVANIEKETPAGKTILAIRDIGEVTLDSKTQIDTARGLYDGLSSDDKAIITNYQTLQRAESKYSELKAAHDKQVAEKLAKQEEERKAEEAKKQAEEAKKIEEEKKQQEQVTRSTTNDNSDYTVYVTPTGGKYHSYGCSYLKGNGTPISKQEAESRGLGPCSRCHP